MYKERPIPLCTDCRWTNLTRIVSETRLHVCCTEETLYIGKKRVFSFVLYYPAALTCEWILSAARNENISDWSTLEYFSILYCFRPVMSFKSDLMTRTALSVRCSAHSNVLDTPTLQHYSYFWHHGNRSNIMCINV